MNIEGSLSESSYPARYMQFVLANFKGPGVQDHLLLPSSTIMRSENPMPLNRVLQKARISPAVQVGKALTAIEDKKLFEKSGTTAFLIIKNNELVYEYYGHGYERLSTFRLFSITQSVLGALVGIAIYRKVIPSTALKVRDALKGFDHLGALSLQNLLDMDSGIGFSEGHLPTRDESKIYLATDCNTLLDDLKLRDPIGKFFHCNDYHPLLITKILEAAWGKPIQEILEQELWQKIGAEYNACLTIDSTANGFAKMESGLNCTAVDLAKIGLLYLDKGVAGGQRLFAPEWSMQLTYPVRTYPSRKFYSHYRSHAWGKWFNSGKGYYNNLWWGYRVTGMGNDIFGMGNHGQILYVSPSANTVAIRLGKAWGIKDWWPSVVNRIVHSM